MIGGTGTKATAMAPTVSPLAKTMPGRAPQATSATQVPFAHTRLSSIPGEAAPSMATTNQFPRWATPSQFPGKGAMSNWGIGSASYNKALQGKRMPGLLAEPKQQQHYQNILRKSEQHMQKYYRMKEPSLAGKPTNWNLEAQARTRPYPGDAAYIKELQDSDALKAKLEALKAQKSFDPAKSSMSSMPFSWGGQKIRTSQMAPTMAPNELQTRMV